MARRSNFRAVPVETPGEGQVENERRFRSSVEDAFSVTDIAVGALESRVADLVTALEDLQAAVADHETRIAALEAAP